MAFEGLLISVCSLIQLIVRKQLKLISTYWINKTLDAVYHNALFQGHSSFTNVLYPLKNLKTLESIVNTELHNLFNWPTSNKLALNIKNLTLLFFAHIGKSSIINHRLMFSMMKNKKLLALKKELRKLIPFWRFCRETRFA